MTRTSVASRRFYRAFYEWTLLTSPIGVSASSSSGHAYHTTHRHQVGESRVTIRRTNKIPNRESASRPQRPRPQGGTRDQQIQEQKDSNKDQIACIEKWKAAQVQTAMQKPFSTLSAHEVIVRYRSEYGIMIEYAAPSTDLERMQKKLGTRLEALSTNHGARIEVQKLSAPLRVDGSKDTRIVSVLVSGTFSEAAAVYQHMTSYNGSRISRETTPKERGPVLEVFSYLSRPSNSLTPTESVLREQSNNSVIMELSLSESSFMRFVATSSISSVAKRFDVSVDVGEPEQRPSDKTSSEMSMARSFLVSGIDQNVYKAKIHILNLIDHAHKNQAASVSITSSKRDAKPSKAKQVEAASTSRAMDTEESGVIASSENGTSGLDFGEAAQEYICHARIEGLTAEELRAHLHANGTELADLRRRTGIATLRFVSTKGALTATGMPSNLAQVERLLRDRMGRDLRIKGVADPKFEFNTMSLTEYVGQQPDFAIEDCHISGPNCQELWTTLMSEIPNGWRDIGGRFLHIHKTGRGLRVYGQEYPQKSVYSSLGSRVSCIHFSVGIPGLRVYGQEYPQKSVYSSLGSRVKALCREHGYPAHKLQRIDATPQHVAQLVEGVRSALRTVTHPVVVITSRDADPQTPFRNFANKENPTSGDPSLLTARGVTVSSFNTVTLDPYPMVSFNLKLPSRSWDAIKRNFAFNVHILPGSSRGAAIAHAFTQPHEEPSQGFEELRKVGVYITALQTRRPPFLHDVKDSNRMVTLLADLHLDKCVVVEDHVIVVGKVKKIWSPDSIRPALSYSMGSYRGADGPIEPDNTRVLVGKQETKQETSEQPRISGDVQASSPLKPELEYELDPLRLGEEYDPQSGAQDVPSPVARESRTRQTNDPTNESLDDPIYAALSATRDAVDREEQEDFGLYEQFNNDEQDITSTQQFVEELTRDAERRPALQGEAEYDFGFDESEHGNKSYLSDDPCSYTPFGSPSSTSKRSYSTFARPLSIPGSCQPHQRRFASSSASGFTSSNNGLSHILDPSAAQSTVSDYLSLPEHPYDKEGRYRPYVKQRSVRGALKAQQDMTQLKTFLQEGYILSRTGSEIPLTPGERTNISHKITVLERKVTVTLAQNAMWHLKSMLDKARYTKMFWDQVPYLESLIEAGMATLMDDAKDLRKMADEGKIEKARYEFLSGKLKGRYEGMEVETGRLRQITEEEGNVREEGYDDEEW